MNKDNKNIEVDSTEKNYISDVMNCILVEMLKEMYDIGLKEGKNMFYNSKCSSSKDDRYEIVGKEEHIEMLLKKYCS